MNHEKQINKHGLSRYIPSEIRRQVRKRCGFGCIVCGCPIYEYEHLAPTFSEAVSHDPARIVLLCGSCHNRVTRGLWSKEKITKHASRPYCVESGLISDAFDVGNRFPIVQIGSARWIDTSVILRNFGESIFRVDAPEENGGPFRLSGVFCDEEGKEIFRIEQNEWYGNTENWDIEIVGRRLTIRRGKGQISLVIQTEPPDTLVIEQINMLYKGCGIVGGKDTKFEIAMQGGAKIEVGASVAVADCAYDITEKGIAGAWHGSTQNISIQAGGGMSVTLRINCDGDE